jgi:hypothetical protein
MDIHLVGGEKGGVGKSFVCRALVQYFLDLPSSPPFVVFDTDRSNPDVLRTYQGSVSCKVAIFSEGERYEDTANAIYNAAQNKSVIVNLPAQVFIPVKQWIEANELLTIAPDDNIHFIHWFVSDGGFDSFKLLEKSLTAFGKAIPHILVKNFGRNDDWSSVEEDAHLQELLHQFQVRIIDFPKFIGAADRNRIDAESFSFGKAREHKKFGSIARQRVKRFLREAYTAFESAGVLDEPQRQSHTMA